MINGYVILTFLFGSFIFAIIMVLLDDNTDI